MATQMENPQVEADRQRWEPRVWEPVRLDAGATRPSAPIRELDIRLPGETQPVDVRVRERGGRLDISVRTSDADLAKQMQADLGDLIRKLESQGYNASARKGSHVGDVPLGECAEWVRDATAQGKTSESNAHGADPHGRKNSQQQSHRNKHRFAQSETFQIEETGSQGGAN